VRNGHTPKGKQRCLCKDCGKSQTVGNQKKTVSEDVRGFVSRLLLERLSLHGICRSMKVSMGWLMKFAVDLYNKSPDDLGLDPKLFKRHGKVDIACCEVDELWSFVGQRTNKQWVWLALDRKTRMIVGHYVGSRARESAQKLWDRIPQAYRDTAHFYSDFWDSYVGVIPASRHSACGKDSGETAHIERFNCTLRQRCSRFVRKMLSFSKKQENHEGALKYFICDYNLSLSTLL